mgnify:CR=1 FL=1
MRLTCAWYKLLVCCMRCLRAPLGPMVPSCHHKVSANISCCPKAGSLTLQMAVVLGSSTAKVQLASPVAVTLKSRSVPLLRMDKP